MNTLTDAQRERIEQLLREGKSFRAIEAETGHRRETIALYARRSGITVLPRRTAQTNGDATMALAA